MSKLKLALRVDDLDNVATIFSEDIVDGTAVEIRDRTGRSELVSVIGNIPYGHKVALEDIPCGAHIIKYGQSIGMASKDIAKGEYVHIHTMKALRGRGDL